MQFDNHILNFSQNANFFSFLKLQWFKLLSLNQTSAEIRQRSKMAKIINWVFSKSKLAHIFIINRQLPI